MADPVQYAELVAQAERAVANVKDPELRRAAFEKILDDLLGSRRTPPAQPAAAARSRAAAQSSSPRKGKGLSGPKAYIEDLVRDGHFKKPKTISQVKAELENRGHHIPLTSLSGPLQKLCQEKVLRRQKTTSGGKQTYSYSEW